jgi:hypothetical protein
MLNVTLAGAGRYGMGLIGPKYANNMFPNAQLTAVVDPYIPEDTFNTSPLKDKALYRNPDEWANRPGRSSNPHQQVVDLALKPELIATSIQQYAGLGVKNMILPKPVAFTKADLKTIEAEENEHHLKLGVASNWAYSSIPVEIHRSIEAAKQQGYSVQRVEMNYDKERGSMEGTTPTYCCFPHAMQVLDSAKLVDMEHDKPEVTEATPTRVAVDYHPAGIRDGIHVQSDMNQPFNRSIRVYLNDGDPEADIVADLGVLFEKDGKTLKRPGHFSVDIGQGDKHLHIDKDVFEDTLQLGYNRMFNAFQQAVPQKTSASADMDAQRRFNEDPGVLTFDHYAHVQEQLIDIQEAWARKIAQN